MTLVAFGATVRGPAHESAHTANQDALGLSGCGGGWFAAACDGLGSHAMSHVGSKAMTRAAKKVLCTGKSLPDHESLPDRLHSAWIRELGGLDPRVAGSTCLAARASATGRIVFAQLGDGLLVVRSAGQTTVITPRRQGFGNETDSLADRHRPEQWLTGEAELARPGDGVLLMTDGVSDDLQESQLPRFFTSLLHDLHARSRRSGKRWLERQFMNWPVPMHGDDKTLAAIFKVNR
jgi:serine/threonine protein phosphatase PrpC